MMVTRSPRTHLVADEDQGGDGDLPAHLHFPAQVSQIADAGPAAPGRGKEGGHLGIGQVRVGHDDQRPRQMGLFRANDERRGPAFIRQAGIAPLGNEGDIPGRGGLNGGDALDLKIGRAFKFAVQ